MKKHLRCLFVFMGCFTLAYAQNNGRGLYMSAADFLAGKLTHASKHTHIKPHDLFKTGTIEVTSNDSTFAYSKARVYGYADKDGIYRFVNDKAYPIINVGETILIYQINSGTGMKNSPIVEHYYFSRDAAAPVQLLTLRNMLAAFSDNTAFTKMLETHFSRDEDLVQYDHIHHQYMINRLLDLSQNQ